MTRESVPETQVEAHDRRPVASFRLVCTEGPERGRSFTVSADATGRVLVGSSSACAIKLADPLVSRRHAALEVHGPSLHVTDLGSKNGTFTNEVAIVEASLWGGETLRLGGTSFRVDVEDEISTAPVSDQSRFGRLIGSSRTMRRLYPFFEQLAASSLPLLIEGDTGTGKELLAESLHEAGPRANGPFVVFDGAQTAAGAIEPTLFGDGSRAGIFEQADGGSLLLDEVGELDAQVQRKLLRVLERGEVQRGGTNEARKVDVRILASTRLDLDKLVQEGAFREDLYYRLVVSRVELPPLRKRSGDVAELARHFWRELGGAGEPSSTLLTQLARHPWPGNVRELKNRIARLVAFGSEEELAPPISTQTPAAPAQGELAAPVRGGLAAPVRGEAAAHAVVADVMHATLFERVLAKDLPLARARELVVNEFEKAYVERVLAQHGGSVAKAAAASGLARRYFQLLRAKRSPRG
ncbi:MAG: sigma 54-interacting transcriptional regulator [Labilithrix sp.]|nr:sigma 54-interacting transcriptional regulator [Labilithrix sp.]MCW5815205.1 sigma 54-interacting transcriptional regulator [Labilithrix sp.]